jgi:hypothetical protein
VQLARGNGGKSKYSFAMPSSRARTCPFSALVGEVLRVATPSVEVFVFRLPTYVTRKENEMWPKVERRAGNWVGEAKLTTAGHHPLPGPR